MYKQREKPKENKSSAVANSVAQKKSSGKQGFGCLDNRPEAVSQRKLQEMGNSNPLVKQLRAFQEMTSNEGVIQNKSDIAGRKRLNKKVTKAIRLIEAGGPPGNNATGPEVQAHDAAMNPGQHHVMRVVRRANLIADLRQRKLDHANNNIRDSKVLNDPANAANGGLIAQMVKNEE